MLTYGLKFNRHSLVLLQLRNFARGPSYLRLGRGPTWPSRPGPGGEAALDGVARNHAGAADPPAVQAPVAAELRHARGAYAQHLGGLSGCHGWDVGKLDIHRQGDDGPAARRHMAEAAAPELRPALQRRQGTDAQPVNRHLHGILVAIALGGSLKSAWLHDIATLGVGVELELLYDDHAHSFSAVKRKAEPEQPRLLPDPLSRSSSFLAAPRHRHRHVLATELALLGTGAVEFGVASVGQLPLKIPFLVTVRVLSTLNISTANIYNSCIHGKRRQAVKHLGWQRDRPRIRGEHLCNTVGAVLGTESSPHTRGAPPARVLLHVLVGIIPACAGSTVMRPEIEITHGDHPRMRGERPSLLFHASIALGSSPHAWGAL